MLVTKKMNFSAAHRLFNPRLDENENREIYGKCSNPHGHGHYYTLEITVKGEIDPKTGMVINVDTLEKVVCREIIDKVDHKNLNLDVDFLKDTIPTMENLVHTFWNILKDKIPEGELFEIKLHESDKNFVVYRGE
jgi:6-pyruvoyltetrahydropterin/6-carboxytetrahydropterin synthase